VHQARTTDQQKIAEAGFDTETTDLITGAVD
jgi:hypothetical protein